MFHVETFIIRLEKNSQRNTFFQDQKKILNYLENPVDCKNTFCNPYELAELLNQFDGGKLRSVLHCNCAKVAGDWLAEYLTTAFDLTGV